MILQLTHEAGVIHTSPAHRTHRPRPQRAGQSDDELKLLVCFTAVCLSVCLLAPPAGVMEEVKGFSDSLIQTVNMAELDPADRTGTNTRLRRRFDQMFLHVDVFSIFEALGSLKKLLEEIFRSCSTEKYEYHEVKILLLLLQSKFVSVIKNTFQ